MTKIQVFLKDTNVIFTTPFDTILEILSNITKKDKQEWRLVETILLLFADDLINLA